MRFSPDGKLLASGGGDGAIRIWDTASARQTAVLEGHSGPVHSVRFSPDGKLPASGSWDGAVRIWFPGFKKKGKVFHEIPGGASCFSFGLNSKLLAVGSMRKATIIQLTGKGANTLEMTELASLFHLPDGEWAAIAPDNRFVCSDGGRNYLAFRDNLAVYPATDLPELECPEGLFHAAVAKAGRRGASSMKTG